MKKVMLFLFLVFVTPAFAFENFGGTPTTGGGFSDFFHMTFFVIISISAATATGALLALIESESRRSEFLKKEIANTEIAVKKLSDTCISYIDPYSCKWDAAKKLEDEIVKTNENVQSLRVKLSPSKGGC